MKTSKHFFSEGEDKYSVADLFYAGVRCGKSWLEKQGEQKVSVVEFNAKDWYVSKVDGKIYNAKFMENPSANLSRKLEIEKAAFSAAGIIEHEEWFIKGAEWADKNPSYISSEKQGEQKSIWHNEDEEPQIGSLILLIMQSGTPIVAKIIEPNHTFNHGERWVYINDLLEKQGTSYTKRDVDDAYIEGMAFAKNELEKQGEKKLEIKYIYPKFRVGDVIEPAKPNGFYIPVRVRHIGDGSYYCESDDRKAFSSIPICNENEYVLTEQKPAWSEEDEKMFNTIIADVSRTLHSCGIGTDEHTIRIKAINFLKYLKQQKQWKPSDEQMKALADALSLTKNCDEEMAFDLRTLYEHLKRL